MNEFIITFRESLEASLIVGIIYVVLIKNGAAAQVKMLWLSVFAAVAASALLGVGLHEALESAGEGTEELFEGLMMYITAALLFYVIFWMSKNLASRDAITEQTKSAIGLGSKWGVFLLVFFAIVREGFETALFLVASAGIDANFSYAGFFGGILIAVLIGYLIVIQGKRIQLKPFFKWTSLLLVLFASGMIAYGTHEMQEFLEHREHAGTEQMAEEAEEEEGEGHAFEIFQNIEGSEPLGGAYTFDEEAQLNIHIMNSKGAVGSFLKGLFGYNSSPTWIEIILWLLSMAFGLRIWRRAYK